jgi:hypothetical protein
MSAARTPGPWHATPGHYETNTYIRSNDLTLVATVPDGANARLIAAAPDLLEALRGVLRVADRATDEFDAARAAIAKATQP